MYCSNSYMVDTNMEIKPIKEEIEELGELIDNCEDERQLEELLNQMDELQGLDFNDNR